MIVHKEIAERDSELLYRVIFENTIDGMEVIDARTGRVVLANQAMAKIFGFTFPQEMIGLNPLDYILTKDRAGVARMMAEDMFQKNLRRVMELRAITRDGREIWLSALGVRIEYQGRLAGLISVRDITAQKLAERALDVSGEENHLLMQNADEAVVVAQEGVLKFANSKAMEVTGYSEKDLNTRPFTEFIHPDDRQIVAELYLKKLKGEETPHGLTFRAIAKEGRVIWFGLKVVSFTWEGKPAVWCFMKDITEQKKAEETLRGSEERLRILFEFAPDAYYLSDLEAKLVDGNRAAEQLTGYKKEELIGSNFLELGLLTADQIPRAAALLAHSIQGQATGPDEFVLNRKDGSHVDVEINTFPVKIKGRNLVLGIARDITERKKAGEALRDSEKHYRLLAENISDVIWVIDMNLRPKYLSPSITKMTGYNVEETMARGMEKGLAPASIEAVSEIVMRALAEKGGPNGATRLTPVEVKMERKDGSKVWAEAAGTLLRGSDGQPVEIMGILRDITERKQAEQQLKESLRKLERTLDGTIQAIALTSESRDRYTAGHQRRVAQLGCAIAREMGFTPDQTQAIRIAGLLHDIGKISVPQEILSKPGKLSDIEFQLIKVHSQVGYDILKAVEFPWPIADIVIQHHERMNGSGYPSGIREDKLLVEARILGVADVVEAMSSHRPYRPPLGVEKALEEISRNSGVLYDPNVVNACLRLFAEKGFKFES